MKGLYKATITIALPIFLLILTSCGGGTTDYVCIPNFIQGSVGLQVTHVVGTANKFNFEVCYNDAFQGRQVTIYGVETVGDIATITAADARLSHLGDGMYPGDRFEVTFSNDDTWFAIYADDNMGNHSTTTQIIRGEFR